MKTHGDFCALGINGGPNLIGDDRVGRGHIGSHDASAALVVNGEVIVAIEEERLSRIKHTNKAPVNAIRFCLKHAALSIEDVDVIAIGTSERDLSLRLAGQYRDDSNWRWRFGYLSARPYIQRLLYDDFGVRFPADRLLFVHHHLAHSCSAYYCSGFGDSLILSLDGYGDYASGLVMRTDGLKFDVLDVLKGHPEYCQKRLMNVDEKHRSDSLGLFYLAVTEALGYAIFDEYKVMGLAAYGNREAMQEQFDSCYTLQDDGKFRIKWRELGKLCAQINPPRDGESFAQRHMDFAAAAQNTLERIVLHMLRHHRSKSGCDRLCLAGGVALNCTLNGRILASGLFKDVWVQPAAHDGGLSLGSALFASREMFRHSREPMTLRNVYLGGDCGSDAQIAKDLEPWKDFISFRKLDALEEEVSERLAAGQILGWMQGRSEFGPRALGARSILADPRDIAIKDRINAIVKHREMYRPLAPMILEERAEGFFELFGRKRSEFMLFSLPVKESKRHLIPAVTHVDGSARIQTVARTENERLWRLISAFEGITGVPVLLNTSFNRAVEPIVETVDDAITSLLTTRLDGLVIGSYFVTRQSDADPDADLFSVRCQDFFKLQFPEMSGDARGAFSPSLLSLHDGGSIEISPQMFYLLQMADGFRSFADLLTAGRIPENMKCRMNEELFSLWRRAAVVLCPSKNRTPCERTEADEIRKAIELKSEFT